MNQQRTVESRVLSILKDCPRARFDDMILIMHYYNRYRGTKKQRNLLYRTVRKDGAGKRAIRIPSRQHRLSRRKRI